MTEKLLLLGESSTQVSALSRDTHADAVVSFSALSDGAHILDDTTITIPAGVSKVYLAIQLTWGAQYPAYAALRLYKNGIENWIETAPSIESNAIKDEVNRVVVVSPGDKLHVFVGVAHSAGSHFSAAAAISVHGIRLEAVA